MQATQVRKVRYTPEGGTQYDPDAHPGCTIYSGTQVQQVSAPHVSQIAGPTLIAHIVYLIS